jgi:DNA-binding NtrC family response regulator
MATDILIVDDEADIRKLVSGILSDEGHDTRTAKNSDEALAAIEARRPNLVFLDIWMQGSTLDGLQLLNVVKEQHPDLPVVMISGHGNIETAVSAIRAGAYDFIEKPFTSETPGHGFACPQRRGRQDHRVVVGDQSASAGDRSCRARQFAGSHQRQSRNRQGARRAFDP